MITTRQVRTDIIYILRPIFHEGVAKLLLGSYLRFRLYGAYVGLELLGNSLIVTFFSSRGAGLLLFFLDRAAFPHSTRPALFTNLYNQCHKDSKLDYRIYKERGDDLAPDIRRCGKSSCEKRKNHQKTTIAREGFHRKTPWFWQTDHNYRYLGAYRWNEQNTNS